MDDLRTLEEQLDLEIEDYALLSRALTHRSYLNENPGTTLEDNERLEFLGDAVLDFVVGAFLYDRYPDMNEGELTSLRAALVRARTLAYFARQINLGEFLRLGYGEAESGGRERTAILCAAFEALIGAIYLDQGLKVVRQFMYPLMDPALEHIIADGLYKDAKSEFQVWSQANFNITPHYHVIKSVGPDHAKQFTVAVMVEDVHWGQGEGPSKQTAAQAAAAQALEKTRLFEVDE